jgi:hypothetical protein
MHKSDGLSRGAFVDMILDTCDVEKGRFRLDAAEEL